MIISDAFVFLHLHKSGGTFVNHMMMRCIPSARRVGYHLPYAEVPDDCRHLPVLGTVRNPWSYYVSWFHFQSDQASPNALFRLCSEDGALDFSGTISNLVTLQGDPARVAALAAVVPDHFVQHGLNLTKRCVERIEGCGVGFYTYLHDRLYAQAVSPTVLKMEGLRERLHRLRLGRTASESVRIHRFLDAAPPLNVSEHGPYRDYYTPDLRALVAQMDAPILDAYGYAF
jgi:hypothetical protein